MVITIVSVASCTDSTGSAHLNHKPGAAVAVVIVLSLTAAAWMPTAVAPYAHPALQQGGGIAGAEGRSSSTALQKGLDGEAAIPLEKVFGTIYITSNATYSNCTFDASNELIIVNSTFSRPISLSFVNSTVTFSYMELRVNDATGGFGSFTMNFYGTRFSVEASVLDGNSSSASQPMIDFRNSSLSVNDSVLSATGTILSVLNCSQISLMSSEFYGAGKLVDVSRSGYIVMSSDVFISTAMLPGHASYNAPYTAIAVRSSESLLFIGSYLNLSGKQTRTGLSASGVTRIYISDSTLVSSPASTNSSANTAIGVSVSDSGLAEINLTFISGVTAGAVILGAGAVELSHLFISPGYAGVVASTVRHGTISYVRTTGGVFSIILQNSSDVTLSGNSAF